ncbi:hypothetical protein L7F22_039884 [Adiantum nelumboides]|nr:hypothetical protein [Adiantum nelumboides]
MQGVALYSWSFTNEGTEKGSRSQGIPKLVFRVVLPIFAVGLLVIQVFFYVFCCWVGKPQGSIPPLVPDIWRYTLKELRMATQEFSETNKVGEGAFNVVYKGTSDNGSLIAVKKLKQGIRREKEFKSKIAIIGACRHRNLLKLQGWCYKNGEAMLVYKFMKRDNLDHYLYGKKKATNEVLDSQKRDVKPANIILADNFMAMLAHFGLFRLMEPGESILITSGAVGTIGYIAPEVWDGKMTTKSDVYTYGVLALEVAYGHKILQPFERRKQYQSGVPLSGRETEPLCTKLTIISMASKVLHEGGCHCRKVRWQVLAMTEVVAWDCNCSNCSMRGNTHFIVPAGDFTLQEGSEDWLTTYTFGSHKAKHRFCKMCGITSFYIPRSNPDGIAVTVRCVDPGTITHVSVKKFDGINWEDSFAASDISTLSKGEKPEGACLSNVC